VAALIGRSRGSAKGNNKKSQNLPALGRRKNIGMPSQAAPALHVRRRDILRGKTTIIANKGEGVESRLHSKGKGKKDNQNAVAYYSARGLSPDQRHEASSHRPP